MLIPIRHAHTCVKCKHRKLEHPLASQCITLVALITTSVLSLQARAQTLPQTEQAFPQQQAPRAPTLESINNAQSDTRSNNTIEAPRVGGSLALDLRQNEGQDAPGILRRDTGRGELELTLDIEQALGDSASLEARLAIYTQRHTDDRLDVDEEVEGYDLSRLFLQLNRGNAFRLRLGRQSISDPMETIIDEALDGLQMRLDSGRIEFTLSHTREDWFEASSVLRQDNIINTMGSVHFKPNKDSEWMPYILHRSAQSFDGSDAYETTWIGMQGIVEPDNSNVRYWIHGMGRDGEVATDDEPEALGGFALDVGINYTFKGRMESTITLALAYATGGSSSERFRQSGLHSNDFALNDKNSFRYFGEVLDPELTNIQIITLGWGAEFFKNWQTDLALHGYQQVEPEDNLRGADLEFDPDGSNKELGIGADIIIAYEPTNALEIKATAGRFIPGDAFSEEQADAWLGQLEVEFSF